MKWEKLSKIDRFVIIGACLGLFIGGLAQGQQVTANQGKPGGFGPWPVTSSSSSPIVVVGVDGGAVPVAPAAHNACTDTTMNVGLTGTACPAAARADRTTLTIQLVQAGETLTVTSDGATTATATAGQAVPHLSTYINDLKGTVAASCRCTAATCSVRITECP